MPLLAPAVATIEPVTAPLPLGAPELPSPPLVLPLMPLVRPPQPTASTATTKTVRKAPIARRNSIRHAGLAHTNPRESAPKACAKMGRGLIEPSRTGLSPRCPANPPPAPARPQARALGRCAVPASWSRRSFDRGAVPTSLPLGPSVLDSPHRARDGLVVLADNVNYVALSPASRETFLSISDDLVGRRAADEDVAVLDVGHRADFDRQLVPRGDAGVSIAAAPDGHDDGPWHARSLLGRRLCHSLKLVSVGLDEMLDQKDNEALLGRRRR